VAKEKNFDNLDLVMDSANLTERKKSSTNKNKKIKTIQILVDWEEKIMEELLVLILPLRFKRK